MSRNIDQNVIATIGFIHLLKSRIGFECMSHRLTFYSATIYSARTMKNKLQFYLDHFWSAVCLLHDYMYWNYSKLLFYLLFLIILLRLAICWAFLIQALWKVQVVQEKENRWLKFLCRHSKQMFDKNDWIGECLKFVQRIVQSASEAWNQKKVLKNIYHVITLCLNWSHRKCEKLADFLKKRTKYFFNSF